MDDLRASDPPTGALLHCARSRSAASRPKQISDRMIDGMGWLKELPLGFRLYFWVWTLFVPAGVALLLAGAVVPGLVLLALFVVEQAVFVPLVVARRQRQSRADAARHRVP
jgi:hypothetical protein